MKPPPWTGQPLPAHAAHQPAGDYPVAILLLLLDIGRIFFGDFGDSTR
jgi:hypothetical protein